MQPVDSKVIAIAANPAITSASSLGSCPDVPLWESMLAAVRQEFSIEARRMVLGQKGDHLYGTRFANIVFAVAPTPGAQNFYLGQWLSYVREGRESHGHQDKKLRDDVAHLVADLKAVARPVYEEHLRTSAAASWGIAIFLLGCVIGASSVFWGNPFLTAAFFIGSVVSPFVLSGQIARSRFRRYWAQDNTAQLIDEFEATAS